MSADKAWYYNRETTVYWAYDENDRVLYIGATIDLAKRLYQHRAGAEWFPRVARLETEVYADRRAAMAAEEEAIRTERPPFNKRVIVRPVYPPIHQRGVIASVTQLVADEDAS